MEVNGTNTKGRNITIEVTKAMLWKCGMLWVFGDNVTKNVTQGIQAWRGFAESFVCNVIM